MKKLNKIFGLFIIAFIFAPLSQCTVVPVNEPFTETSEITESNKGIVVDQYVVFDIIKRDIYEDTFVVLMLIATFISPLILSLINPKSFRGQIMNNLAQIIASGWLLIFSYAILFWIFYEPLLMGYLLLAVAVVLNLINIFNLIVTIKNRKDNNRSNGIIPAL